MFCHRTTEYPPATAELEEGGHGFEGRQLYLRQLRMTQEVDVG